MRKYFVNRKSLEFFIIVFFIATTVFAMRPKWANCIPSGNCACPQKRLYENNGQICWQCRCYCVNPNGSQTWYTDSGCGTIF